MNTTRKIISIFTLGFTLSAVADSDNIVQGGTWTKKNYSIKGSWSIVTTDEGRFLELDKKFKTRNAPDLKLFLSPLPTSDVTNQNAMADSKFISPLRQNKGAQRYEIPVDTDLDDYQTLVLHCAQYSKLRV